MVIAEEKTFPINFWAESPCSEEGATGIDDPGYEWDFGLIDLGDELQIVVSSTNVQCGSCLNQGECAEFKQVFYWKGMKEYYHLTKLTITEVQEYIRGTLLTDENETSVDKKVTVSKEFTISLDDVDQKIKSYGHINVFPISSKKQQH